ncbi:hypothetical protein [Kineococcus sp. NPDC059986]|jgi:F0F1-type ATP synthase assembly protein I|uniref:hypothetical protein n=1 Tax=Kineococcus sp. NPDC059986 TaxID=3155538 RepID=UPI0034503931
MTQRRSTEQAAWARTPGTWIALAVAFAAISVPQWVQAFSGDGDLAYLPAVAFALAALAFLRQARRCARSRG